MIHLVNLGGECGGSSLKAGCLKVITFMLSKTITSWTERVFPFHGILEGVVCA